jgi:hypothetical protein
VIRARRSWAQSGLGCVPAGNYSVGKDCETFFLSHSVLSSPLSLGMLKIQLKAADAIGGHCGWTSEKNSGKFDLATSCSIIGISAYDEYA